MMTRLLTLDNLHLKAAGDRDGKLEGVDILKGVSLAVARGEKIGLIGKSGAGKSTLALAAMGLLPSGFRLTGDIIFDGHRLTAASDQDMCQIRGGQMAMIFQEAQSALNPLMSVGAQVAESIRLHQEVSKKDVLALTEKLLERVGLNFDQTLMASLPHELSGGQCQRVMIAMALAGRPKLLIADEATTALDTVTQASILSLLKDLVVEENMALLMISHDLAVVKDMVDRVVIIDDGTVIDETATRSIKLNHPRSREIFAASRLPPLKKDLTSETVLMTADRIKKTYLKKKGFAGWSKSHIRAVDMASLELWEGECLGLVGASGAGKSTLARVLLGLEAADHGEVTLDGHPFRHKKIPRDLRRRVSAVFQDHYASFNPLHKAGRIIAEPLEMLSPTPSRKASDMMVAEILLEVGLSPQDGGKYIHQFSSGQRQRIALARALITRPDMIILDEALSSLDVLTRRQILTLLDGLMRRLNLSFILIGHNLAVVRSICHRVAVMDQGKIVEQRPARAFFASPESVAGKALLAAMPSLAYSDGEVGS